jgi:hypothetical protein
VIGVLNCQEISQSLPDSVKRFHQISLRYNNTSLATKCLAFDPSVSQTSNPVKGISFIASDGGLQLSDSLLGAIKEFCSDLLIGLGSLVSQIFTRLLIFLF